MKTDRSAGQVVKDLPLQNIVIDIVVPHVNAHASMQCDG